ncbi:hypothetical protein IM876_12860 [Serratia plymuthica]|uniref:MrpH family fimbial adhesin n=1 Tax=Serratia plymuthica TaxID=82996 RepID=UPI001927DC29|nr:hypothetical protein [Serratia plymuthica]MBL3523564.1 hypothetical protein [Serratia plymuthica]
MISHNNYTFKYKIAWLIKHLVFLFVSLFLSSAHQVLAGTVWRTTNAPIISGYLVYAISYSYNASAVLESIDYNDQNPNPCYHDLYCKVGITAFTNQMIGNTYLQANTGNKASWGAIKSTAHTLVPGMEEAKTMGELYTALRPYGLYAGMSVVGNGNGPAYCDPEKVFPGAKCIINDRWQAYSKVCYALGYQISQSYIALPGQGCIGPTPPNNECKVDSGSVILDHGELTTDKVNGNRKNVSVRISCTLPANADLVIYSKDANEKIMLKNDNSLYSTVTIDGISGPAGKTINIPQGGVTINLESTLHTVGNVQAGPYSGTAILVINNY